MLGVWEEEVGWVNIGLITAGGGGGGQGKNVPWGFLERDLWAENHPEAQR